jgi:hypothetical protein
MASFRLPSHAKHIEVETNINKRSIIIHLPCNIAHVFQFKPKFR